MNRWGAAACTPCSFRPPSRPPGLREGRRLFLRMPFEIRQMCLGLYRHPEDMPKVMAEMQASFQKELEKRKKK